MGNTQDKTTQIDFLLEELKLKPSIELILKLNKLDLDTLKLLNRSIQALSMKKLNLGTEASNDR